MTRLLTDAEIERALTDLPGWRRAGESITATYAAPSFPDAIRLVDEVALEAESMNHHPDIDIRWRRTTWTLSTHDAGGLTQLDVELAHRIAGHARRLGASA
ncbi:MAG: 4a-hydroxytetrahydrobiopterin dehydratase [Tetrasphaera sp.]|nr:4a-hydroxytetrahydrobiopterin dehydratase [Tetrasphaera sp.]